MPLEEYSLLYNRIASQPPLAVRYPDYQTCEAFTARNIFVFLATISTHRWMKRITRLNTHVTLILYFLASVFRIELLVLDEYMPIISSL